MIDFSIDATPYLPSVTRRGFMFVLSSPSGAGKSSITRALMARDTSLTLSISTTSRRRRPGGNRGQGLQFCVVRRFSNYDQ